MAKDKKKKNDVKDIIATIDEPIKLKLKQPLIIIIKRSGGKRRGLALLVIADIPIKAKPIPI